MAQDWHDDVLAFWFDEMDAAQWFNGSDELDNLTRSRFAKMLDELSRNPPKTVYSDPRQALAAVLLFDQFPRNMYRGMPRAFATDDIALRIARQAVDARFDDQLSPNERLFLYMPFQHSEVSADQGHSVMLFGSLALEEPLRYAIEHRDIIDRFGRFPHRNAVLGRESTAEELAFLEEHAGYGQ